MLPKVLFMKADDVQEGGWNQDGNSRLGKMLQKGEEDHVTELRRRSRGKTKTDAVAWFSNTHSKWKHHTNKTKRSFKDITPLASVWNSFLFFSFPQCLWKWCSSTRHKDQKKFFCLCTVGVVNNNTSKESCSHGLWGHKFHLITVLWIELEHSPCCTTLQ